MPNIVFKAILPDAPDRVCADPKSGRKWAASPRKIQHRWDRDPAMAERGWPSRIHFNGRNYRSRHALERFKARLVQDGLAVTRKVTPPGARKKKTALLQAEVERVKQAPRQVAQRPLGEAPQRRQSKTTEEV